MADESNRSAAAEALPKPATSLSELWKACQKQAIDQAKLAARMHELYSDASYYPSADDRGTLKEILNKYPETNIIGALARLIFNKGCGDASSQSKDAPLPEENPTVSGKIKIVRPRPFDPTIFARATRAADAAVSVKQALKKATELNFADPLPQQQRMIHNRCVEIEDTCRRFVSSRPDEMTDALTKGFWVFFDQKVGEIRRGLEANPRLITPEAAQSLYQAYRCGPDSVRPVLVGLMTMANVMPSLPQDDSWLKKWNKLVKTNQGQVASKPSLRASVNSTATADLSKLVLE
jgi:hypothetical protein